ncbi:1,2-phenylacetyl-CoA epoxidase PaaB subunit, partial [Flavobacterium sp. CG_9.10]|uniref:SprB repeat-containing protein n=1 Tax=Flavobacterium sp. CG_9.10 TaxID=2787729 RepID=UPI0018CA0687
TATGGTGTLMYSANDGSTYQASNIFSGLTAGTYLWAVKDANNCVLKGSVTITQPTAIAVSAVLVSPKCNGGTDGSITITASGGTGTLMYSANDGSTYQASNVFSGLTAGTYLWAVKDANNCVLKGSVTITQPTAIAVSAVLVSPKCNGGTDGSITITATGGTGTLMYSANDGSTYQASNVFSGLTAGTYLWAVKDANNCVLKGSVTITQPTAIAVSAVLVSPKCNGGTDGSITITATGGTGTLMYSANDGSTYQASNVFSGLTAGTYLWAVKDANNCVLKGSVTITQPTAIAVSAVLVSPKCNGGTDGSITITATGGTGTLMYSANDGSTYQASNVFSGLTAGTYLWAVKDANNCVLKGSVTITQPTAIAVSAVLVSPKCNGGTDGSITITATGGTGTLMYSANDGTTYQASNVFSGLTAGTYLWAVKDANNCVLKGSVTITQPTILVATDGHSDVKCNGGTDGSVTVTFSGGT